MTKVAYHFSVLRYMHDTVTQEFVNIGVAVFAPEAGFLRARCADGYARISHMFLKIDGSNYRQMVRYIQSQVEGIGKRLATGLPFHQSPSLQTLLSEVLPADDSAFQFSKPGVGLTSDPTQTLNEIFHRHVETYAAGETASRSDGDVWRVFREPLDRRNVTPRLKPKTITAPNFEYKFESAWKNGSWRVLEPVSFDLVEESSILDKANRWVGRVNGLIDSPEKFTTYLLLGEPRDSRMRSAFFKAQNLLNKIPGEKEFILESDRESFADELAHEMMQHAES
jgi:hypothetical protein